MLVTVDDAGSRRIRTSHHRDLPLSRLLDAKGATSVSVCLPARDEAATVGRIVETIRRDLIETHPLVDEVLVLDDHSTDDTARVAAEAGARVVDAARVAPSGWTGHGKGQVLWKSVFASRGDIIVWCDADIEEFPSHFVSGLLGPLLVDDDLAFVKGFYHRPEEGDVGGGRVTELVARPLLSLLHPALAGVIQPLSGEYAVRRSVIERVPFAGGYGVDVGLLIEVADRVGLDRLAQVDLDVRHHRNRPLSELSPQALSVAGAILRRAGVETAPAAALSRPGRPPVPVDTTELPAPVDFEAYLDRSA